MEAPPQIPTFSGRFNARPALEITLAVWKGLFLREALYRLLATRSAPLWLFFEPVFHVAYLLTLYSAIRMRVIGGMSTPLWLLSGIIAFLLFKRTFSQATQAIDANTSLFSYRQVKPVDTLIVRAGLELLIMLLVAAILFAGIGLLGYEISPDDPIKVMVAIASLWLFALSWGMIASVAENLVPELGNVNRMISMPLYIISGTIVPISHIPQPYLDWLMLNPIAHALELVREGFSNYYHVTPGTSMSYLLGSTIVLLFFGLALQRRFALRLTTQ